jgi:hypothetical protein
LNQAARDAARRKMIRSLPLKFVPARKGGDHNTVGYLVLTTGTGKGKKKLDKGQYMFALKRRVFMPARPYVRRAVKKARPKILQLFSAKQLTGVSHLIRGTR